jgi:hypothetical protein
MTDPIIIPRDYDRLRPWFDMLRQINSTIAQSYTLGTLQFITIGVLLDDKGKPQFWTSAERKTLNPKDREIEIKD